MDPDTALQMWLDAIEENDTEGALAAHGDLMEWLAMGGFEPSWPDESVAERFFLKAVQYPGQQRYSYTTADLLRWLTSYILHLRRHLQNKK